MVFLFPSEIESEGLSRFFDTSEWLESIVGIALFALCSMSIIFANTEGTERCAISIGG